MLEIYPTFNWSYLRPQGCGEVVGRWFIFIPVICSFYGRTLSVFYHVSISFNHLCPRSSSAVARFFGEMVHMRSNKSSTTSISSTDRSILYRERCFSVSSSRLTELFPASTPRFLKRPNVSSAVLLIGPTATIKVFAGLASFLDHVPWNIPKQLNHCG